MPSDIMMSFVSVEVCGKDMRTQFERKGVADR